MARAASSSCGRVRAATATVLPGSANATAIARPIPRTPPVTSTFMSVLGPVAGVFVQERQRFEAAHAIEKQNAVQMIGLVLDDAGREVVRGQFQPIAVAIERADADVARPRHP